MKTATFLALDGHTGDEITYIDHVAQLAEILAYLHTLEEVFCLFIQQVETIPGTLQAQVTSHDSHIVAHAFAHFLDALGDEHLLFIGHGTLIIPCRHLVVEVVFIHMLNTVLGCCICINDGLDEGVARQTVAAMKTSAGAFA